MENSLFCVMFFLPHLGWQNRSLCHLRNRAVSFHLLVRKKLINSRTQWKIPRADVSALEANITLGRTGQEPRGPCCHTGDLASTSGLATDFLCELEQGIKPLGLPTFWSVHRGPRSAASPQTNQLEPGFWEPQPKSSSDRDYLRLWSPTVLCTMRSCLDLRALK